MAEGAAIDPRADAAATVTGRVRAFDLARGAAVLGMVMVHVLFHWSQPALTATPFGLVVGFLGGPPAAPVFMFLMGASIAFSRHASPRSLAVRGVALFAGGYALNLARGTIPAALGLATGVVRADEIAPFTPTWLLGSVDILQLAGCSLVLIAMLLRFGAPRPRWLGIGAFLVVAAPLVRGLGGGVPVLGAALGPIWGDASNVFYPVVPWAMYPIVGAVFGSALVRARTLGRERAVLGQAAIAGALLAVAGGVAIVLTRPAFDVTTYWHHPPAFAVAILGFVLCWTWACDRLVAAFGSARPIRLLERAGRRVTAVYVVHWLIIGWGIGLVGFRALELSGTLVAMVLVFGAASAVAARLARPDGWAPTT